jgi:hypothetical protein
MMTAASRGFYPKLSFKRVDINRVEETSETIKELNPDVIFNSADLYPFWRLHEVLPSEFVKLIGEGGPAGYCSILPLRLILPYRLMNAVKRAGVETKVLITNDPCEIINPLLGKIDLAPLCGIGDFAHIIEPIKIVVGSRTRTPMRDVGVFFIGDFATYHIFKKGIRPDPSTYYLKVVVNGRDVTKLLGADNILLEASDILKSKHRRSPIADQHYTASIGVGDILSILFDRGDIRHCPGPLGLVGGYPVRLKYEDSQVVLPDEIDLEEAVGMNEKAQREEGIEKVMDDGTVVFTDKAVRIMDDLMSWDLKRFNVMDCERIGEELGKVLNLSKKN